MVITDRTLVPAGWALAQAVASAITGGANFLVLAESDLPAAPRRTVAEFVRDGVKGRTPYLVTGDPSFAAAIGADGVHIEDSPPDVAGARALLGADKYVGVTVRTVQGVGEARAAGADYGVAYLDWAAPDQALRALEAFTAAGLPVVAGMDVPLDAVARCIRAGAAGVAISYSPMAAYDRTAAVAAYLRALAAEAPAG